MNDLFRNNRFYMLLGSVILSVIIYVSVLFFIPQGTLQIIRLTQIYAFLALFFLYLTVLAGPFCYTFRNFSFRKQYLHATRALGVSSFYFAFFHVCFAFFGQLGGFSGLAYLTSNYIIAISVAFISFLILFLLALTSFDVVIKKITFKRWKILHRFVYLAGVLILVHSLMLGTHFHTVRSLPAQLTFIAVAFLFFLEARRFDVFLEKKFAISAHFGIITTFFLMCASFFILGPMLSQTNISPLGIHSQHIQIARNLQNNTQSRNLQNQFMQGDTTKRYTVSFDYPQEIAVGQEVTLAFTVYDASSGNRVTVFEEMYEKVMHLIIVDESLDQYFHIHPTYNDGTFSVPFTFPKNGKYHLYIDFKPFGVIEQQMAFTTVVGETTGQVEKTSPDTHLVKEVQGYTVSLSHPTPLIAKQLTVGEQTMTFTLKDTASGEFITSLKPYLGAYGHLVMINQETFDYLHVHPTELVTDKADGGPDVSFMPIGLHGEIKPGTYKIFAQFNPNDELILIEYTVLVE